MILVNDTTVEFISDNFPRDSIRPVCEHPLPVAQCCLPLRHESHSLLQPTRLSCKCLSPRQEKVRPLSGWVRQEESH